MKRDLGLGDDVERMWEWGAYFRDRRRWETCGSIESKFQPGSDDYVREGWGDPEKPPAPAPKARDWVLRAMAVQDAMSKLAKADGGRKYVWALTYAYAYPSLPKFVVLRLMRKYTDRRMGWKEFRDLVDVGRIRVWTLLKAVHLLDRRSQMMIMQTGLGLGQALGQAGMQGQQTFGGRPKAPDSDDIAWPLSGLKPCI